MTTVDIHTNAQWIHGNSLSSGLFNYIYGSFVTTLKGVILSVLIRTNKQPYKHSCIHTYMYTAFIQVGAQRLNIIGGEGSGSNDFQFGSKVFYGLRVRKPFPQTFLFTTTTTPHFSILPLCLLFPIPFGFPLGLLAHCPFSIFINYALVPLQIVYLLSVLPQHPQTCTCTQSHTNTENANTDTYAHLGL